MQKILIVLFFLAVFGYTIVSAIKISSTFTPDFSVFYHAAADIMQHTSPYTDKHLFTVFNYPLVTAVLFVPLALLPYGIAQTIFIFLNVFLTFGICSLCFLLINTKCHPALDAGSTPFIFFVSLVFLAFPTKFTIGMGQVNLLAYFFLLLGFLFYQKEKFFQTILFLVLSIFVKPLLGFILLAFLFEKQWKYFIAIISICLLLFFLVPILFHQNSANTLFVQTLFHQSLAGREVYYNQGLLGFISRLTNNLQIRFFTNSVLTLVFVLVAFFKMKVFPFVQKTSLLLTLLVIIDPLSWQHHFVFLILPFLVTYTEIQNHNKKLLLLILLGVSYALLAINIQQPNLFFHFPQILVLSNQFYGAVILFALEIFFFKKLKSIL